MGDTVWNASVESWTGVQKESGGQEAEKVKSPDCPGSL